MGDDFLKRDKITNPYYVTLTGSKNNAGDFLIKHRAFSLFDKLRSDRDIVDFNGWEELDSKKLDIVNKSKALILLGGPALQQKMVPNIYKLPPNLDDITVPIIIMGVGWYSPFGQWSDTHNYPITKRTKALLERVSNSGYMSSVRDYHTLNMLLSIGFDNYIMTGCPALYDLEHVKTNRILSKNLKKVAFSLGVSLKESSRMFKQMQIAILETKRLFDDSKVDYEVVFHHGLGTSYMGAHGGNKLLHNVQVKFVSWLESHDINYVDISGSAENLINYYKECDLHIGYRVHAHIFMSSISKPSVLLNEDGRGKALYGVLGGLSFDAYTSCIKNKVVSALHKVGLMYDNYQDSKYLPLDLYNNIKYELSLGKKFEQPLNNIELHYEQMYKFINQLP